MKTTQHTQHSAPLDLALDLESIIATAAEYLGKVPSFGDGIGNEVSKPQLGLAYHELIRARDLVQQLRAQRDRLAGALEPLLNSAVWAKHMIGDVPDASHYNQCILDARKALASLEGGAK